MSRSNRLANGTRLRVKTPGKPGGDDGDSIYGQKTPLSQIAVTPTGFYPESECKRRPNQGCLPRRPCRNSRNSEVACLPSNARAPVAQGTSRHWPDGTHFESAVVPPES